MAQPIHEYEVFNSCVPARNSLLTVFGQFLYQIVQRGVGKIGFNATVDGEAAVPERNEIELFKHLEREQCLQRRGGKGILFGRFRGGCALDIV